jgi:hypothetical protein
VETNSEVSSKKYNQWSGKESRMFDRWVRSNLTKVAQMTLEELRVQASELLERNVGFYSVQNYFQEEGIAHKHSPKPAVVKEQTQLDRIEAELADIKALGIHNAAKLNELLAIWSK